MGVCWVGRLLGWVLWGWGCGYGVVVDGFCGDGFCGDEKTGFLELGLGEGAEGKRGGRFFWRRGGGWKEELG